MNTRYTTQFKIIKHSLGIKHCISIRFANRKSDRHTRYRDTACTALARSLLRRVLTYIDRNEGQLCPGGNFFLGITRAPKKEIYDTYAKDEKVFSNQAACRQFLNDLPPYPRQANKRFVLFTPLDRENQRPEVVTLLATPAQTGRILGLSVFKKMSYPTLIPALSTCASIYTPLTTKNIHINFIDYYDRYYQGKQNGKLLWKDSQMIVAMPYAIFQKIVEHIQRSAHGNFKPKLKPEKVDPLH